MRRQTAALFLLGWFACVALHGAYYVWSASSLVGAQGYEATWQFQLSMFSIMRLPFWLLVLLFVPLAWHARPHGSRE